MKSVTEYPACEYNMSRGTEPATKITNDIENTDNFI